MTDRAAVSEWVDRYVDAWTSNDPDAIGALFADDARYFTAPYREPWSGREAILQGWLDRKEEPHEWRFQFEVKAVDGDLGVVAGTTDYVAGEGAPESFSNLWLIRLDVRGRCTEFIEYWMRQE
jgi:uncharacterized protein (TIGR02246 family)